jgi:uncharacterized membrane protein HdeD (DUF308 family)
MRMLVLWPVFALWRVVGETAVALGRTTALVVGLVLLAAGAVLALTVVGAVLGVPLLLLGAALVARALR